MNMPLIYRAAMRGVFGKRTEFSRGSITDALFVYLDGELERESAARADSLFKNRPLVCLTNAWEEWIRAKYPGAAVCRRTMMKPACRFIIPGTLIFPQDTVRPIWMKPLLNCDKGGARMESMLTVTEVSGVYGVSARMPRHYEKLGLIASGRKEDYAWRVYRPEDIQRLRQTLALRKLRLSLKEIGSILNDPGPAAISVFEKNLSRMDEEIQALQAVRGVIEAFLRALRRPQSLPAAEARKTCSIICKNA